MMEKNQPIKAFKGTRSPVLVAHAYNPSYLGGRDQEEQGSKPAWANRPYFQKTHHKKRAGGVARGYTLSSSPSITKRKNF
jgi:hypothetical protein